MLINELQKFKDPVKLADNPRALAEQDDEIFNKARLVNCGYVRIYSCEMVTFFSTVIVYASHSR